MSKLIGLQSEEQKALLHLLDEARKPIEEGNVQAVCVVLAMKNGPAWAMAGSAASALFLALDMCKDEIKEKIKSGTANLIERAAVHLFKPRKQ